MRKYVPNILTVLAAIVFALLWHSLEAGDRDGYGLVTMGLAFIGVPITAICGAIAAVCSKNIIGTIFGKIAIFGVTLVALLVIMN